MRDPAEYFKDIKKVAVNEDSLELAETLIKKKAAKFDPSKFVDGYEVALKELVNAKVNHLALPEEEAAAPKRGKVVNLMDALRKSVAADAAAGKKKPVTSVKDDANEGLSLVKPASKGAKRKSA